MNAGANWLDSQSLMETAEYSTGARGMADAQLRQRLEGILAHISAPGILDRAQCFQAREQVLALLCSRLRIASDCKRLPAIQREPIERPIFGGGGPRTGTTLLQSLLVQDAGNRAPEWWQTHQPSPSPGEQAVTTARVAQARRALDAYVDAVPGILMMHPYWDSREHALIEDEEIFSLDLHVAYPTMLHRIPTVEVMSGPKDATAAYGFHRAFLQHQQWGPPPRRWVLKGVLHQYELKALFAEYPDALCLWTHRDPVEGVLSMLTIMAVLYGAISGGSIDWRGLAPGVIDAARDGTQRLLDDPLVDDPRIRHVRFKELVQKPIDVVRSAYDAWNLPYLPTFEAAINEWLSNNRSDRYGRYDYTLDAFGIAADDLKDSFSKYRQRFGV
jgi:Sulfotransferase family